MAEVEARIPNRRDEMRTIAALVEQFGLTHLVPSQIVNELNVALDEVLNNIISYGYEDAGHHDISVRLELRGGIVEVVVEDDGKPFNPLAVPAPDLTIRPRAEGGVGLHFVRTLTDGMTYARHDGINQLRLTKRLPSPSA